MSLSYSWPLAAEFYTGEITVATESRWDVGLGGHSYMVDWDLVEQFQRQSVPLLRDQQDTSERPGEQSINPNGLWRRSVESWHHGAGQSWLDRADSNPFRFHTSKGVDPWDKHALSLLPGTELATPATGSNQHLAASGGRLYASDGATVSATGVGDETLVACTATPAAACTSLTSDGATVYAGFGGDGIHTATGTAFASFVTGTVDLVRYVKGRLMCAAGPNLYNPTAAGALPAPLYTHPTASWVWTDLGEGTGHIYAAGFAGDKSMIYKAEVKPDGTALDIPVVAGVLPDGEIAHSVTGYLGFVVIGTSLGVRFAAADANGYLTLGSLIPTNNPVLCGEGQDRFVWYGLSDYDGASTGLGRLDLSTFTADLTPAYATDLMAAGQGNVQAVATYLGKRWFTVNGAGVYKQSESKVASGTICGGRIGFGLPDEKTALYLTVRHDPLDPSEQVAVTLSIEGETPTGVGVSDVDASSEPGSPFQLVNVRGNDFEWALTLTGDVTLRSVTLRADPTAERSETITVPILLRDRVNVAGVDQPVNVLDEWEFLNELRDTRRVVTYQEGITSRRVIVEDTLWQPWRKTADGRFYQGTYLVKLKGV